MECWKKALDVPEEKYLYDFINYFEVVRKMGVLRSERNAEKFINLFLYIYFATIFSVLGHNVFDYRLLL